MSLQIQCTCGKTLRVPEAGAGKRVRCPACGQSNTVPAGKASTGSIRPASPAPAPPPVPQTITFRCDCGQSMQAKAQHAGLKTRCPSCQSVVSIPGKKASAQGVTQRPSTSAPPAVPRQQAAPPGKRSPRVVVEDEEDDYEDEAPRRRKRIKRRSSALPWILVGVGALLLILTGGGLAAWYFLGGTPDDLALVPGDAALFAHVRVGDALETELGRKALEQINKTGGQGPLAEMQQTTGLQLSDIDRFTMVVTELKQDHGYGILLTTKPMDRKTILTNLGGEQHEASHEGRKYVVVTKDKEPVAFHWVNDKFLLVGDEPSLKRGLELLRGKRPSGPQDAAIKKAAEKHHVVVGFVPPPNAARTMAAPAVSPALAGMKSMADAKSGSLIVDIDNVVKLEATIEMADESKANEARKSLDGLKALGGMFLPALKGQMTPSLGPQGAEQVYGYINAFVDSIQTTRSGSTLTVRASCDVKGILDVAGSRLSALAMGGMQPPGMGAPAPPMANPGGGLPNGGDRQQWPPPPPPRVGGRGQRNPPPRRFPSPPSGGGMPNAGGGFTPPAGGGGIGSVFKTPQRVAHENNLKQLVLAMHSYQDAFNRLPPAMICDPAGKPLLSWRVSLLPFLDANALYQRFKLDEPWDSPNNLPLLSQMPRVFALPGRPGGSKTCYQVFVGPHTPWDANGRALFNLANMPDGTSNTMLIAEGANLVDWTKPDDMHLGPGIDPRTLLGGNVDNDSFYAAMADGVVLRVSRGINLQTLRNAIDPADGNVLGPDWPR